MPWMDIGIAVVGLVVLSLGADLLVRGAARVAIIVGISPLVIGLTIVAMGTSAPELVVSVQCGLRGQDAVAVANVVGSNIFNVVFILGICALAKPLVVSPRLLTFDVPFMVVSSLFFWYLASSGDIAIVDGILLLLLMAGYLGWTAILSRRESAAVQAELLSKYGPKANARSTMVALLINSVWIVTGLSFLIFGGRWFVDGSIGIARYLEISDAVIGLTIIAAGTSMPEAATSLVATIRGERDIAIGNVVGSNIFNLLFILGIASLVTPGGLKIDPSMLRFDIPVMCLIAVACYPLFRSGREIVRWEGGLLFAGYLGYVGYLLVGPGTFAMLR